MEKKEILARNLNYFIELRNIKIDELSRRTGISPRLIYTYRTKYNIPRASNLRKLAVALNVCEADLLENESTLEVKEKIEKIEKLIKKCKPHYIEKNFTYLKRLLEWTDETSLSVFDFLIEKSSSLGKAALWCILNAMYSVQEFGDDYWKLNQNSCNRDNILKSELDSDRLAYYMKLRDIRVGELSQATEISRNTIHDYCNGMTKPRTTNLYKLANVLDVRVLDLLKTEEPPDAKKKADELKRLLEQCQPYYIKKNCTYFKRLLEWTDETSLEIFDFLMGNAEDSEKIKLWHMKETLCRLPEMKKDYISPIQIFYTKDSYGDNTYECQVKFEPWVYTIFGREEKEDDWIQIDIKGEEDSPEWHEDMRDQLEQIIFEEWANQIEEQWLPAFEELLMSQKNW